GGTIAIDPVLGRIAFPGTPQVVEVLYHRGWSADMGGGEYDREAAVAAWYQPRETPATFERGVTQDAAVIASAPDPPVLKTSIPDALADWNAFVATRTSGFGLICVMDSRPAREDLAAEVPGAFTLAIVAADWPVTPAANERPLGVLSPNGRLPVLAGDVTVTGTAADDAENPGTLILDGLLLAGTLTVTHGHLGRLLSPPCTLVPWTDLGLDRLPLPTAAARLVNLDGQCRLEADRSILGAVRSPRETTVRIAHSILDATAEAHVAFAAPDRIGEGVALTIEETTIHG